VVLRQLRLPDLLDAGDLPESLDCYIPEPPHEVVRSVILAKLRSRTPTTSIPDAPFFERDEDEGSLTFSFSNQCDNIFTWTFPREGLKRLANGFAEHVEGHLHFQVSDMKEAAELTIRCN
jgi:hypothetical protein